MNENIGTTLMIDELNVLRASRLLSICRSRSTTTQSLKAATFLRSRACRAGSTKPPSHLPTTGPGAVATSVEQHFVSKRKRISQWLTQQMMQKMKLKVENELVKY